MLQMYYALYYGLFIFRGLLSVRQVNCDHHFSGQSLTLQFTLGLHSGLKEEEWATSVPNLGTAVLMCA